LQSSKKVPQKVRFQRSQALRQQALKVQTNAAQYMTTAKWHARKQHAVELLRQEADYWEKVQQEKEKQQEDGNAQDDDEDDDPMSSAMMNPLNMLKGNMAFMVQNMVMMQGIQHFFSGFILLQVPFPLSIGFKHMFQRGLADLPDLAPSYVSSVSWYFLVMYGLRSFFQLAIGDPQLEVREQEKLHTTSLGYQHPQMAMNPNAAKQQETEAIVKQLRQDADRLEMILQDHKSEMDGVEKRLLGKKRYPKRKVVDDGLEDFLLTDTAGSGKKKKK